LDPLGTVKEKPKLVMPTMIGGMNSVARIQVRIMRREFSKRSGIERPRALHAFQALLPMSKGIPE
jgi:hypothetical protein